MAIRRGTRSATFIYLLETFAMLGTLAGAAYGIYLMFGESRIEMITSAFRYGFFGFIGGSAVGIILGAFSAIFPTIFRRSP